MKHKDMKLFFFDMICAYSTIRSPIPIWLIIFLIKCQYFYVLLYHIIHCTNITLILVISNPSPKAIKFQYNYPSQVKNIYLLTNQKFKNKINIFDCVRELKRYKNIIKISCSWAHAILFLNVEIQISPKKIIHKQIKTAIKNQDKSMMTWLSRGDVDHSCQTTWDPFLCPWIGVSVPKI